MPYSSTGGFSYGQKRSEISTESRSRAMRPSAAGCRMQTSHRQSSSKVLPGLEQPMLLLDGTTLLLPHSEDLERRYPATRHRHGTSHWSLIRVLLAHEAMSGLAVRPCYGPVNGPQSTSEQRSEEHTSELQSRQYLVCRLLLEKKKKQR